MCLCGLALVRHGVETRQGLNLILRDLLFAIALYQLQLTCGDQFRHLSFPGRILIYRDSSIVRKGILKTLGQLTN